MQKYKIIACVFLVVTTVMAHAQSDSVQIRKQMSRVDSIDRKVNGSIDAIQLKINSLLAPDVKKLFKNRDKKDSLQSDSSKNVRMKSQRHIDSLSLISKDKIQQLKKGQLTYNNLLDPMDSIKSTNPATQLKKGVDKLSVLQKNAADPLNQIGGKVNDKLLLMNKEGVGETNLPTSLSTSQIKNSNIPIKTPQILNPKMDVELTLPQKLNGTMPVQNKIGGVQDFPKEQINKLKAEGDLNELQDKLGKINQITDKGQSYQGEVKEIAQGNISEVKELPKILEEQAGRMDELQGLKKETGQFEQYSEIGEKMKEPEALKEQAFQQSTAIAINHFAGKQQVLQGVMDDMSKLKDKYSSLSNLKDIPRKKRNEMNGKPFTERIVPGIAFQIQKKGNVILDYNPLIGFRLTTRFTVGTGWNERITIGKRVKISLNDRIYGPRVFADFKLGKGFSARTDIEKMNTYIPALTSSGYSTSEEYRAWVWSAFVGVKKEYSFVKKIKGTFQIMYNLYNDHNNSPYAEKLNVRFGFDFPMKRKAHNNKSA